MATEKGLEWADFNNLQSTIVGLNGHVETTDKHALRLAAVLAFGRRTSIQPQLDLLMQDAVALVNEVLQGDLAGFGEVGQDGKTLTLRTASVDSHGEWIGAKTHKSSLQGLDSMAAFALNSAMPVVSEELVRERRFTDLFLRQLGVVSALAVPLHIGGQPYGVLGVYATSKRTFDQGDVQFAETIGHLLSSSSGRLRAEAALSRQRRITDSVEQNVRSLVMVVDPDGLILEMNAAAQRTTQFSLKELGGTPFWNKLIAPQEQDAVRAYFRSSRNDRTPCEFESMLVSKNGDTRRLSWSLQPICDERQRLESILLTGDDRTELELIEQELLSLRKTAAPGPPEETEANAREFASVDSAQPEQPKPNENETTSEATSGADQRSSPRRVYRYQQSIAPIYHGQLPTRRQFVDVECRDISAGGIAFVLDEVPDFRDLVVALGRSPQLTHFTATVARTCEIEDLGRKRYLVGCRFTGRVNL